jgi:hypothetical protein
MLVDAMQARDSSAQSNALRRVCELIETDSGDEHRVSLYSQLKLAKNMVILVEMLNSGDGELRGLTFKLLWFATRYDPFRTLLCKDLFVGPLCRALKTGEFCLAPRFASFVVWSFVVCICCSFAVGRAQRSPSNLQQYGLSSGKPDSFDLGRSAGKLASP